ncbi:MetQ/NlpA family ABC transporter substrate-binding protein [Leadbettera azotonutricia]|uniref:Lipoprotein n=1 Tax=Leadbettera azotonutricia (strain ATCC BAA-888 / DSM 13862 / ZAS-9) TaxID=545695 RepID=F5Y9R8_LEAAZ|nr:MetQ/NlpA family ABC transporter substrate-binding protein [Leadbettera azotonutricia]AEF80694.1 D-methionine-binding lipoprotein MetQ [Leadbettera azotonutricia ZAS-9]
MFAKKKIAIGLILWFSITVSFGSFSVFASGKKEAAAERVVKIGIVGDAADQWKPVIAKLAAEGIKIELVEFTEYVQPNRALQDGEIDLNSFQHYAYLNNEIKTKGYSLTAIGETLLAPLGLYSQKIKSVGEIKAGDKIALPNDVVNGGRSFRVLEKAGLIKIPESAGPTPSKLDITENPLNLEFVEVEAAQTPRVLPDVTAAFINGGHAVNAGLNPERDSIALEKQDGGGQNPYINVIAARTDRKDDPVFKRIVNEYRTDAVKEVLQTVYKGAFTPAW